MANYLKPQSPLQKGTDYIYPLTTADQIIIDENGTRLGDGDGNLNINVGSSVAQEALEKANAAQSTANAAMPKANFSWDSSTATLNITL